MKINTINTETNITEATGFNIEANAMAFHVLSSGIYSNKIGSIIREILTNAHDAHIMANTLDIPIDVYVPMYGNNTFTIRDYGTGLSEEEINSIYTTYFASTKRNSNSTIGCFGLGSKTPFSYTSSFTVTSYYEGTKNTYIMTVIDFVPSIKKIKEESTLEPNGLHIVIPVQEKDVWEFQSELQEFLAYNNINVNTFNFSIKRNVKAYSVSNVDIYKDSYKKGIYVRQGENIYPVDENFIHETSTKLKVEYLKHDVLYIINVPIGNVSVATSREQLHYDTKTIECINKAFKEFLMLIELWCLEDLVKVSLKNTETYNFICAYEKALEDGLMLDTYNMNPSNCTKVCYFDVSQILHSYNKDVTTSTLGLSYNDINSLAYVYVLPASCKITKNIANILHYMKANGLFYTSLYDTEKQVKILLFKNKEELQKIKKTIQFINKYTGNNIKIEFLYKHIVKTQKYIKQNKLINATELDSSIKRAFTINSVNGEDVNTVLRSYAYTLDKVQQGKSIFTDNKEDILIISSILYSISTSAKKDDTYENNIMTLNPYTKEILDLMLESVLNYFTDNNINMKINSIETLYTYLMQVKRESSYIYTLNVFTVKKTNIPYVKKLIVPINIDRVKNFITINNKVLKRLFVKEYNGNSYTNIRNCLIAVDNLKKEKIKKIIQNTKGYKFLSKYVDKYNIQIYTSSLGYRELFNNVYSQNTLFFTDNSYATINKNLAQRLQKIDDTLCYMYIIQKKYTEKNNTVNIIALKNEKILKTYKFLNEGWLK